MRGTDATNGALVMNPTTSTTPTTTPDTFCTGEPIPDSLRNVPTFATDAGAVEWAFDHIGEVCLSTEFGGNYFEVEAPTTRSNG